MSSSSPGIVLVVFWDRHSSSLSGIVAPSRWDRIVDPGIILILIWDRLYLVYKQKILLKKNGRLMKILSWKVDKYEERLMWRILDSAFPSQTANFFVDS